MAKFNVDVDVTLSIDIDEAVLEDLKKEKENGDFDNRDEYVDAFRDYAEKKANEVIEALVGTSGITGVEISETTVDDEPEGDLHFSEEA